MLHSFKTIHVQGLKGVTGPAIPTKNDYGIEAAITWDSAYMTIMYKIPTRFLELPTDTSKPVSIGFELPAPDFSKLPPPPDMEGDDMGGPPPGMGGGPDGMGGPPPPMGGPFAEMRKADVFWTKVKLGRGSF